jgi:hypothetical protein
VLVYDATSPSATRTATSFTDRLPVGYPVVPVADLPAAGTLRLDRSSVAGTLAWIDADGTAHLGRAGVARALIACGGRDGLRGHALALPAIGRLIPSR